MKRLHPLHLMRELGGKGLVFGGLVWRDLRISSITELGDHMLLIEKVW